MVNEVQHFDGGTDNTLQQAGEFVLGGMVGYDGCGNHNSLIFYIFSICEIFIIKND